MLEQTRKFREERSAQLRQPEDTAKAYRPKADKDGQGGAEA